MDDDDIIAAIVQRADNVLNVTREYRNGWRRPVPEDAIGDTYEKVKIQLEAALGLVVMGMASRKLDKSKKVKPE